MAEFCENLSTIWDVFGKSRGDTCEITGVIYSAETFTKFRFGKSPFGLNLVS